MNTDDRDRLAGIVSAFLMDASQEFFTYATFSGTVGIEPGYGGGSVTIDCRALADAILAAGWRPPKPPCEHRMIVHGGACGSCGQMPPPPTEEDLALLRTALARIERAREGQ